MHDQHANMCPIKSVRSPERVDSPGRGGGKERRKGGKCDKKRWRNEKTITDECEKWRLLGTIHSM